MEETDNGVAFVKTRRCSLRERGVSCSRVPSRGHSSARVGAPGPHCETNFPAPRAGGQGGALRRNRRLFGAVETFVSVFDQPREPTTSPTGSAGDILPANQRTDHRAPQAAPQMLKPPTEHPCITIGYSAAPEPPLRTQVQAVADFPGKLPHNTAHGLC